jgi:hypothetical protein
MLYLSIALMLLPAICYSIVFGKFAILYETVVGSFAYIFYMPTEFCLMPIYAKCRIDNIYGQGKNARYQKLKETWQVVKMIEVAKYIFWNVAVGMTLIAMHEILLVKMCLFFVLIFMFIFLTLSKWIPGFIYICKYKYKMSKTPLEPTQEERESNITDMKLRIFETIKAFEDDFIFNIKESFEEAAIFAENKEVEKKLKAEAAQKKLEQKQNTPEPQKMPNPLDYRGGSIAFGSLLQANQPNLTAKVQHIRESSAIRPSYYPFQ